MLVNVRIQLQISEWGSSTLFYKLSKIYKYLRRNGDKALLILPVDGDDYSDSSSSFISWKGGWKFRGTGLEAVAKRKIRDLPGISLGLLSRTSVQPSHQAYHVSYFSSIKSN
jgi:hypothetical protein